MTENGVDFILKKFTAIVFPFLLTFIIYLHLNGETSPGGGFVAGVLLATLFIFVSFGFKNLQIPLSIVIKIMITSILLYFIIAFCGFVFRSSLLDYSFFELFGFSKQKSQQIGIFWVETCVMIAVWCSCYITYKTVSEQVS